MAPKKKCNTRQNAAEERATVAKPEGEQRNDKNSTFMDPEQKNGREPRQKNSEDITFMMDRKLCGESQYHGEALENVYCRLPLEEFLKLRVVCKAWYSVVCKRMALNERIHKPFFTLCTKSNRPFSRLEGILTYNKSKRLMPLKSWLPSTASTSRRSSKTKPSWVWTRRGEPLGFVSPGSRQIFANEGLVCSHTPGVTSPGRAVHVLDWNLSSYHRTRPVSAVPYNGPGQMVIGMSVLQKGQNERQPFKIVLGSLGRETQVFDSESHLGKWETQPCRPIVRGDLRQTTGCASCNGRVYITMEFSREILVYDCENASWSSIDAPGGSAYSTVSMLPQYYRNDTLGAWNGHVLDVVDDANSCTLSLWELVDETEWRVFDRMPPDLYRSWLKFEDGADHMADFTIHASFCGDYVLVYSWDWRYGFERAWRYCLLNMATKVWQQLEVNDKKVLIKKGGQICGWDGMKPYPGCCWDYDYCTHSLD